VITNQAIEQDTHAPEKNAVETAHPLTLARAPAPTPGFVEQHHGQRPRVLVVGAGFGGLSTIKKLADTDVDVLLIDKNNYHGFWPLLYQVATAGLEPEAIAYPVRGIVRNYPNINFIMAEVQGIDFDAKCVLTDSAPISYDYLVVAAGSANNYFGNDALAEQTFGMKDIDEAERLRNHVLTMFEQAVRETDPERRAALLTFVLIGGGPTGVELAGAFVELIRHVLLQDYPMLNAEHTRVILVEAHDTLLAPFAPSLQKKALQRLTSMGVEVRLNTALASVGNGTATFKDGSSIPAETVVWAAGVRGSHIVDDLNVELARGFRVKVTPTLNLANHSEVFVIGDMAYLEGYKGGAYPMVAPVAVQMGKRAAANILAMVNGEQLKPFRYFDKGQMATIGRKAAVLDAFGIRLSGFLAWIGWLFVHLVELIGFRNRLIVLTNWAYSYFTYDRSVRLITWTDRKRVDQPEQAAEAQNVEVVPQR
jgi:NADH dehydrogenase